MYFLPLGFSFHGKLVLLLAASVIALLGLFATPIMPLWQTILIVVLLIGVSSYLLTGKIPVVDPVTEEDEFELSEESSVQVLGDIPNVYNHIATSDYKEGFYQEEEGLLEKAMRNAGKPRTNALITSQEVEENTDFTELGLTTFTEVAVTEEQQIDVATQSSDHAYLGDVEEMLVVEGEGEDEDKDKLPVSSDSELGEPDIEAGNTLNSLSDLDDLEELDFDDFTISKGDSTETTDSDEEFWNSLLEDDDELEVIEEKKELADIK